MVYPRPESCDTPRALMSVTPNLCCDENQGAYTRLTVPMQYFSLQHQTLLLSPVSSTTGNCFLFGPISLFFLELFLHSSPVAYWAPTDLGSSSFRVLSFCLFTLFTGLSRQEYWSGLPFPSPVDRILSELSTMSHPSWVALHGMPHDFIELDKAVERVRGRKECLEAPREEIGCKCRHF